MKLLVLGGTRFLGLHLVEAARAAGHEVAVFNRGLSRPEALPGIENLRGDRDGGLDALAGREWDAVIDTSGYFPRVVGLAARFFADRAERYVFISTISVYADFSRPGLTEQAELATTDAPASESRDGRTYGALKALCEAEVLRAVPERSLIIRPGLIVGPHDPTDRFTYWPLRAARGGTVLAPDGPGCPTQFIDARDLAAWTVRMACRGGTGIYHATSRAGQFTLGDVLQVCRSAVSAASDLEWVSEEFLLRAGVTPWMDLPLWVPEAQSGMLIVYCRKAFGAGLSIRPITETVTDLLAWAATRSAAQLRAGLSPEREAALLEQWRSR